MEDDRSLSDMIEVVLGSIPHVTTSVAADEASALSGIRRDHPSLIILDLMLPYARRLLGKITADSKTNSIPILALSTWQQKGVEVLRQGGDDVLHTPFDVEDLVAAVERNLLHRREQAG